MSHGVWVLGPGRFILRPPGRTVGGHHVLGRHTAVTAARRRLQEAARHRPGLASRGDAGQGQGRRFTRTTLRGRENRGRTFGALSGRGRRFGGALWVFQSISRSRSTFHRLFGYSCFFVLIHARHPRVGIHSGVRPAVAKPFKAAWGVGCTHGRNRRVPRLGLHPPRLSPAVPWLGWGWPSQAVEGTGGSRLCGGGHRHRRAEAEQNMKLGPETIRGVRADKLHVRHC